MLFRSRRINEEKMRQWVSRQDVDNATDDQLKDRGWLNPDETYDPYKSDEIDYGKDDGGPVLMKDGGRAEMAFGGLGKLSPYAGPDYLSPGYPGFIQIKDIPHSQPWHGPHPQGKLDMGSLGGGGGDDGIEGIGKSASSLLGNVSKLLGKSKSDTTKLPDAVPSEEIGRAHV